MKVNRNLSQNRVAAYECSIFGSAVQRGKWVTGWYGGFHEERLKEELMPKLTEYVHMGLASYPILLVSYLLESQTDVSIEGPLVRDVKFRPRRRRTLHQNEVIVHSEAEYQVISRT
jgi:hypothetical protein